MRHGFRRNLALFGHRTIRFGYCKKSTNDKIFLLSYNEAVKDDYWFNSYGSSDVLTRRVSGSDYAECQGLMLDDDGYCWWILRTPGFTSSYGEAIDNSGSCRGYTVSLTSFGVRPALRLKDLSNIGKEEHEHNYVKTIISSTCEEEGYTLYQCECGTKYRDNFISAKGHTYGEYVSDNNATCAANGTKTAICARCKATDTKEELGTRKEHDFYYEIRYEATCTEEGTRIQKCHNCNWMIYEHYLDDHSFGNKDSKCKDCGYDRTKGCSCKCHKGGITGFFFKIGLFFQKIFKKNKICNCGKYHY